DLSRRATWRAPPRRSQPPPPAPRRLRRPRPAPPRAACRATTRPGRRPARARRLGRWSCRARAARAGGGPGRGPRGRPRPPARGGGDVARSCRGLLDPRGLGGPGGELRRLLEVVPRLGVQAGSLVAFAKVENRPKTRIERVALRQLRARLRHAAFVQQLAAFL